MNSPEHLLRSFEDGKFSLAQTPAKTLARGKSWCFVWPITFERGKPGSYFLW